MADCSLAPTCASGIYEIVCLATGKRYVGSAKSLAARWRGHRTHLRLCKHHNRHLQAAWNKHGPDAFVFRTLLRCDQENLLLYEQIAIDALCPEFNTARRAGNTLGVRMSPETRAKIAAKALGRKPPPRSEEHRAKLSAIHKGRTKPPEVMAALQAGRRAHVKTTEERTAISAALRRAYESGVRVRQKSDDMKKKLSKTLSKLSAEDVREIRRLHAVGVMGIELSERFRSPRSTISQIVRGLRYRWVTE